MPVNSLTPHRLRNKTVTIPRLTFGKYRNIVPSRVSLIDFCSLTHLKRRSVRA